MSHFVKFENLKMMEKFENEVLSFILLSQGVSYQVLDYMYERRKGTVRTKCRCSTARLCCKTI